MKRVLITALSMALALLAACGGGGGTPPAGGGDNLLPLDFDLVSDPGSNPSAEEVEGWQLGQEQLDQISSTIIVQDGEKVVAGMQLEPETAPGTGFSGQITVRPRSTSQAGGSTGFKAYLIQGNVAHELSHVVQQDGSFTFRLDALGTIIITEQTARFTVSAFADLSRTNAGTPINFWAIARNGVDPITFNWDFGDGGTASGAEASHAYSVGGEYAVSLTARDALGNTAPLASTTIEIADVDAPPIPLEGVTVAVTLLTPLSAQFSATVAGGDAPLQYAWDFGDGATDTTSGATVAHEFASEGLYEGSLVVTDDSGDTADADFVFDARRLELSADTFSGEAPLEVGFTLEALGLDAADTLSVGIGGVPLDDPQTGAFTHTFVAAGSYQVRASATRVVRGVEHVVLSDLLVIFVTESPLVPTLQLTQPINPEPGGTFELYGFGFGDRQGNMQVFQGPTELEVLDWTPERLVVELDADSVNLDIQIVADAGESNVIRVSPAGTFPTVIQNIIPPSAAGGDSSRSLIIGHGFGDEPGTVSIDGSALSVEHWDEHGILVLLPSSLADGTYDVLVESSVGTVVGPLTIVDPLPAPSITQIAPQLFELGMTPGPTVQGVAFGGGAASLVYGGHGLLLPAVQWSNTAIELAPPTTEFDTFLVVLSQNAVSNGIAFGTAWRPSVDSVSPQPVLAGDVLTLTGQRFGLPEVGDEVLLGAQVLQVVSWTDTQIEVTLPGSAVSGELVVRKRLESDPVEVEVLPRAPGQPDLDQL